MNLTVFKVNNRLGKSSKLKITINSWSSVTKLEKPGSQKIEFQPIWQSSSKMIRGKLKRQLVKLKTILLPKSLKTPSNLSQLKAHNLLIAQQSMLVLRTLEVLWEMNRMRLETIMTVLWVSIVKIMTVPFCKTTRTYTIHLSMLEMTKIFNRLKGRSISILALTPVVT